MPTKHNFILKGQKQLRVTIIGMHITKIKEEDLLLQFTGRGLKLYSR
jgi:hypothetical protein